MLNNTWRITGMFHMPSKTITHYVCFALFYNTSDNIIHHGNHTEQLIIYYIFEISRVGLVVVVVDMREIWPIQRHSRS